MICWNVLDYKYKTANILYTNPEININEQYLKHLWFADVFKGYK